MLITVSNHFCDNLDRYKEPDHFTNRLPLTITVDEPMKENDFNYYVRLEGISIEPWPTKPLIISCSLCNHHQLLGQSFKDVLSLTYGLQKFTRPKVHAQMGRSEEIEIELKSLLGETIHIDSVTVQLSVEKYK